MIRRAQLEDLPRIMEIVADAVDSMRQQGICQWNEKYPAREVFAADIEAGTLYVQETENGVVGMFALDEKGAQPYAAVPWGMENAEFVHLFAVAVRSRGYGEGEQMLRAAQKLAQKAGYDSLRGNTQESNLRMRRLLARCGFHLIGDIHYPGHKQRYFCYEIFLRGQNLDQG